MQRTRSGRRILLITVILAAAASAGSASYTCEDNCRQQLDITIKRCQAARNFSSSHYDSCISNAFVTYRACIRQCIQDDYQRRRQESPQ